MLRFVLKKKDLVLTPALEEYIYKKIVNPLKKILGKGREGEPILEVEAGRVTHHHHKGRVYRMEANLTLGSRLLRAESESEDMREAIDRVEEELRRQVRDFREKADAKLKRRARAFKNEQKSSYLSRSI